MKKSHSLRLFRIIALIAVTTGLYYIVWRYTSSLNWDVPWLSIPFVLAETYGIVDMVLFLFTLWKPTNRISTVVKDEAISVDVFITTYNEEPNVIELTARAACRIYWKNKRVYVLDDGNRASIREITEKLGCDYITRGAEWQGMPRHAKAGNVNNALVQTTGEFILILDADQIVAPTILERTLGYFEDPLVAFVQTPQYFYNTPPGDPFGTDAPLFYGPILQGKDGWNAAFFCGSNAVLRREALMQLGVTTYVKEVEKILKHGLIKVQSELQNLPTHGKERLVIIKTLRKKLTACQLDLRQGKNLGTISDQILQAVQEVSATLSQHDLNEISTNLRALADDGDLSASFAESVIQQNKEHFAAFLANAEAVGISSQTARDLNLTRGNEAIPVQALYTESITEDMATALRLHAMGFKSVYHNEILAQGLAPEDLGTSLTQRLRWAQGTIQVFLKENPLTLRGLSLPQRLMYFTTIFSYFNGFSNILFLLGPILWFFTAIAPVYSWTGDFFWHFIPYFLINRLVFSLVSRGFTVWKNEQYSVALFPLWIRAVVTVVTGQKLTFVVTPKQRQAGNYLKLVWPQIVVVALTLGGLCYALTALLLGAGAYTWLGFIINAFWGIYNCIMLSAVIRAATYQPPNDWNPQPPDYGKE